jgi:hypothetical protein
MKFFSLTLAAFLALTFSGTALAKDGDVHEKVIGINDVYIPSGFDSRSDAFIVANGWFPHSCYKLKGAEVEHVGTALHQVTIKANVTEGLCLTVIIPFHKEVQLGKLAVGDHAIRMMNGDGTYLEKHLVIEQ